jgi:hypothetical protein
VLLVEGLGHRVLLGRGRRGRVDTHEVARPIASAIEFHVWGMNWYAPEAPEPPELWIV